MELINIMNMGNLLNIVDIVMNFIALGIVAEFDDYFLYIYTNSRLKNFIG